MQLVCSRRKACTRCNGESFQRDSHPMLWHPTLAASWSARLSPETERLAGDCARCRISDIGYRISDAPAGPSLSSWRSVTWKNCARTQRYHGVTRIVTISCTDSDDAVGAGISAEIGAAIMAVGARRTWRRVSTVSTADSIHFVCHACPFRQALLPWRHMV